MTVKNCTTCAHRHGTSSYGKCLVSGYYCETERKYPQVCGTYFDRWQQRPSIFQRIKAWFV
jgi:hypothetical protein